MDGWQTTFFGKYTTMENTTVQKSVYEMARVHHWAIVLISASAGMGIASHYAHLSNGKSLLVGIGAGILAWSLDPFEFRKMKAEIKANG